jgi:hypothetical protein
VCKRCLGRRHTCIYAPKRSPWIVYTDAGKESRGQTRNAPISSSAASVPEPHVESMLDDDTTPGPAITAPTSAAQAVQPGYDNVANLYSRDQLHWSLDAVPSHSNWSGVRIDVHGLMNQCKVLT